jgi:phosphoserine phosphatase RsbX
MYDANSQVVFSRSGRTVEVGSYVRPCSGELQSGDAVATYSEGNITFFAIIDALGHGARANAVAVRAIGFLERHWSSNIVASMSGLHRELTGTDGAAVGLCVLDLPSGQLRYGGIGNTVCFIAGKQTCKLRSQDGIVGVHVPTLRESSCTIESGDTGLLLTDGISDDFYKGDRPSLFVSSPRIVSRNVIKLFGRKMDDAACLAFRYVM